MDSYAWLPYAYNAFGHCCSLDSIYHLTISTALCHLTGKVLDNRGLAYVFCRWSGAIYWLVNVAYVCSSKLSAQLRWSELYV